MAHPKRRQSKTRTRKRRTHDKAVAPTLAVCPIAVHSTFITLCAPLVAITEVRWLS